MKIFFVGSDCRFAVTWQADSTNSNNILFEAFAETDDDFLSLGFSSDDDMVQYNLHISFSKLEKSWFAKRKIGLHDRYDAKDLLV